MAESPHAESHPHTESLPGAESLPDLEQRIDGLRSAVRAAAMAGDRARARTLRADLRAAEAVWDEALAGIEARPPGNRSSAGRKVEDRGPGRGGGLLTVREQVHQALTVLGVPAAPRLIVAVHEALGGGEIANSRLTSLRRDEERSFAGAPHARPYYLCAALTADHLSPARALLAVSTWDLPTRIVGPLSARTDFLTSAIRLAGRVARLDAPPPAALRLLWRFAVSIPGAADGFDSMRPRAVAKAAQYELDVHHDADRSLREAAAERARTRLTATEQLFGARSEGVA